MPGMFAVTIMAAHNQIPTGAGVRGGSILWDSR